MPDASEPRHRYMVEVPAEIDASLRAAQVDDGQRPSRRLRALASLWAEDEDLRERVREWMLREQDERSRRARSKD